MTEKKNVVAPSDEISDAEKKLRESSAIEAAVANLVRKEREGYEAEIVKAIQSLESERTTIVPDFVNKRGEEVIRTSSPTAPLYRHMSEEEREWRNPDSDHWMAEWLRAKFDKDKGAMLTAETKLEGMFGRATTVEGAAGASGAISAGTGGSLIPRPLEAVVQIARDRVAKARRLVRVMSMTRQQHTIPTAGAMTAGMVAEGTSGTSGEPTFASVALVAKTGAVKALASREILADAAVNLVGTFAQRGGSALGVLEDDQVFSDGDGVGANIDETVSGTTYTLTTATQFGYVDALGMFYGVAQQYRQGSVWMVSPDVLELISNVRDAANGRPLYTGLIEQPGAFTDDAGQIGTILRKPVYEVPFPAGTVWFGNAMDAYTFGARQGIEVDVSEHVRFLEREVAWIITERFGGVNVDAAAAQIATGVTSANNG